MFREKGIVQTGLSTPRGFRSSLVGLVCVLFGKWGILYCSVLFCLPSREEEVGLLDPYCGSQYVEGLTDTHCSLLFSSLLYGTSLMILRVCSGLRKERSLYF